MDPQIFITTLLVFITGTIIGSFLNVVIDRFATKRSIFRGRSYCEFCKKTLEVRDLVPIFSYLLLKGKCRFCKKKIPVRLLLVELVSGLLLLFTFVIFGTQNILLLIIAGLIVFTLTAIFFIDLEYGIIPDKLIIFLSFCVVMYLFQLNLNYVNHLLAAVGSFVFFVTLFLVTKGRGMGFGDVKLSFELGLLLGYPLIVYGLYLAFLTGAIISIILVLWRKKSFRQGTVPFGPFLAASTLFVLFFGERIILPLARILF